MRLIGCILLALTLSFQAAIAAPALKSTQIDGQVFIVTKGQQAIKLPLVKVSAVAAKDVEAFIKSRATQANAMRAELASTLRELKQKQAELDAELEPLRQQKRILNGAVVREFEKCRGFGGVAYLECTESASMLESKRAAEAFERELRPTEEKYADIESAIKSLKQKYAITDHPDVMTGGIGEAVSPIATTKTDADGKFSLSFKSHGDIAIVATAKRSVVGEEEQYQWVVWVRPGNGGRRASVTLANDNLVQTGCDECLDYAHLIEHPIQD